ncbi:MAG: hypothetical protein GEU71_04380 [Actinobacteria bacterium]|nr:hypothetical protein [Actinomycetota bacterium]
MAESHFDPIDYDTIRGLLEYEGDPAVSIFMPTHRRGPETELDTVQLKNLLADAATILENRGLRRPAIESIMEGPSSLLDDRLFWQHQLDGLALFSGDGFFQSYRVPLQLAAHVYVNRSFHTKPLLPALGRGHFYVLALSLGSVRLMRGTKYGIEEIDLSEIEMPFSLDDTLRFDEFDSRGGLQNRPAGKGGAGGRLQFHGHGPGGEDTKAEALRHFQGVSAGIGEVLRGEKAPLVVAAVDYLHPIFRQATDYQHVTGHGIDGNPDRLSAADLHERAWPIVEPLFDSGLREAIENYGTYQAQDRGSCTGTEVLTAAFQGRVDVLLLRAGASMWGTYDFAEDHLDVHGDEAKGEDLLDLAARQTVLGGGRVYVVEPERMPCPSEVAALFRY